MTNNLIRYLHHQSTPSMFHSFLPPPASENEEMIQKATTTYLDILRKYHPYIGNLSTFTSPRLTALNRGLLVVPRKRGESYGWGHDDTVRETNASYFVAGPLIIQITSPYSLSNLSNTFSTLPRQMEKTLLGSPRQHLKSVVLLNPKISNFLNLIMETSIPGMSNFLHGRPPLRNSGRWSAGYYLDLTESASPNHIFNNERFENLFLQSAVWLRSKDMDNRKSPVVKFLAAKFPELWSLKQVVMSASEETDILTYENVKIIENILSVY